MVISSGGVLNKKTLIGSIIATAPFIVNNIEYGVDSLKGKGDNF